ncbi:MAG: hypothetical protein EA362_04085 [Saprospirales bacterium]|nr:MAG: hypothetical protein EA362_04085 [Saprospirales bacterium]
MIKKIFYFHTRERNTLLLLLTSTILYSLSSPILHSFWNKDINTLEVISLKYTTIGLHITDCHQANLLQKEDLIHFGMNTDLAERWIHYRQRVGGFFKPEDFQNVWGLNDRKYEILAAHLQFDENPYFETQRSVRAVRIPSNKNNTTQPIATVSSKNIQAQRKKESEDLMPFCINTANAEQFQKIRGIGPVLSDRIIKYRERLGGFYSIEQLKEVFGIEDELIDNNSAYFKIEDKSIYQLDWQEDEFRNLLAHPYLDYDQVVCIMQQKRAGAESASDLEKCFDELEWEKIIWYL